MASRISYTLLLVPWNVFEMGQLLLQVAPNLRPSVNQILAKPFMQQHLREYLARLGCVAAHTLLPNSSNPIPQSLCILGGCCPCIPSGCVGPWPCPHPRLQRACLC